MNERVSNSQVGFKLSVDKDKNPTMHIWDWDVKGNTTYNPRITCMNLAMEGFKYYAKSDEDGKAIWAYLDNALKTHTNICDGKIHKFGNSKVRFSDPGFWGVDVVFVND